MAYATVDENTFYVHGGIRHQSLGGPMTQFYALDLTQNWDTSNPPWRELAPAPYGSHSKHFITIPPDHQTLTIWSTGSLYSVFNYSIADAIWTRLSTTGLAIFGTGFHAATDPTNGAVYVPAAGPYSNQKMSKFSFVTGSSTLIDVPPTLVAAQDGYSFAWCQTRKSFILFTGNTSTPKLFFEYLPSTGQWGTM
ncbi:hypothetical protein BG015_001417, partial [Linnemannia schmuckeri]